MGGILSNEEKAARIKHGRKEAEHTIGVPWDPHGYRYREQRVRGHRSRKRGKGRSEEVREVREGKGPRGRSQSLDAILEELYLSENEGESKGAFIPRAKLTANRSTEGKLYSRRNSTPYGSEAVSLHAIHMQVERKTFERSNPILRPSVSLPFLDQSEWEGDMEADHASLGPPSYSKDFDACMRQLEAIERSMQAQQDMEISTLPRQRIRDLSPLSTDEQSRSLTMPRGRQIKRQMTPTNESAVLPPEEETSSPSDDEELSESTELEETIKENQQLEETAIEPVFAIRPLDKIIIIEPESEPLSKPIPRGWYCNLKDQFEKLDQELGNRGNKQEAKCRIMGATLKKVTTQAEEDKGSQRKHYFSQLVRSNKSLIDEELPDPDKVQNIRAMFQEQHARLGGSLQNISTTKPVELKPERPKSALGSRNDDEMRCLTPDSVDGVSRRVIVPNKTGLNKVIHRSERNRSHPRWTDSGSMSSGVSSDLSSCETDQESYSRDAAEPMSSDDELDDVDKHYIQNEILEKIRAFGTSVTYFGGQMIRCSVGPLVSPTTHAILEEIGQKQPSGVPCTRSFDEFYKKYKETTKKRKVGRTRSFQQEEIFQKPNVFNNTEIEAHKMELETAFGIRRPNGKQATGMKTRLGKSFSLDSRIQNIEKAMLKQESMVEKKKENVAEVKTTKPSQQTGTTYSPRYQVNSEYFDYNARIRQQKIDMEFEEFEVFESLSDKLDKIAERKQSHSLDSTLQDSTRNLEVEPKNKEYSRDDDKCDSIIKYDTQKSPDSQSSLPQDDINEQNTKASSVQEKRNSWEEAIQQKRLSVENHLNERKDGTDRPSIIIKSGSTDSNVSDRSNSTEDIINNFEAQIKRDSIESDNGRHSSECSSESTQSIDFGSVRRDSNSNQNTWGKQAQLRRINRDDSIRRRSSSEIPKTSEENKSGTWRRFVESRQHCSTENLAQSRRNSLDSQTGNRRNSVKKLTPLENGTDERNFCQEARKLSLELRRLSLNREVNASDNGTTGKRSSAGGSDKGSRRNSVEKEEKKGTGITEVTRDSTHTSRRGSRESPREKRSSIKRERRVSENRPEPQLSQIDDNKNGELENGNEGNVEKGKKDQTEYKITIKISQTENESYKIGSDKFEEIVINDPEPMDSLELYFPKPEGDDKKVYQPEGLITDQQKENNARQEESENEQQQEPNFGVGEYKRRFDRNRNYKPQSRWPMETTVVVDMEKSEEVVPKLITQGKSHVKTTRRLF